MLGVVKKLDESFLMRRAISLLMTVVMVLAPCTVVHAGNPASHHGGKALAASDHEQDGIRHAVPRGAHEQASRCDSGDHNPNQDSCSKDCNTLQRVTSQSTVERTSLELETSFAAIVDSLNDPLVVHAGNAIRTIKLRPVDLRQDSKSVLHTSARLRL